MRRHMTKDVMKASMSRQVLWRRDMSRWQRMSWFGAGAVGAAAMYFADPEQGRQRRAMTRDRVAAMGRAGFRTVRGVAARIYGITQQVQHLEPEHWSVPNDATLAQRVESELFRDSHIPKGRINVNAEAGIIVLRGEVDHPEQIRSIEETVSDMPGVRAVHNLLHLPRTPVPNRGSVLPAP